MEREPLLAEGELRPGFGHLDYACGHCSFALSARLWNDMYAVDDQLPRSFADV